ncbi:MULTISPECIES: DUF5365 family protein [Bacillus]|uniref:DUF5365 family protein n=1 Tax=Bacillus TaxID=1386 RepID=UPI0002E86F2F|nr:MULTISPECIES: DUF5365 family protein [Bacillus]
MKIAFASTEEQEKAIEGLILTIRSSILPNYISEKDLKSFDEFGLLQFTKHRNLYNGTLAEAYHVMVALQTIIQVIEHVNECDELEFVKLQKLFNRNVQKLQYYGIFFPFSLDSFTKVKANQEYSQNISQPLNDMIM